MDNLFCCLHRAELGGEAAGCPDPQLPVRVRLPAGEPGRVAVGGAPAPPTARRPGPRSIVQALFGIDVQARPWQLSFTSIHIVLVIACPSCVG